jgi:Putative bacterial sensory transduction regulator
MPATLEVITREEITIPKLHEVYTQAFMHSEIQAGGDIKLELESLKLFVKVQPEKKILSLYALFGVKPGTTRLQVLELCNRINDGLVMVRACTPAVFTSPALWLDHDLDIESGMTADDIVSETRRFRTVIAGVPGMDTEDVLT